MWKRQKENRTGGSAFTGVLWGAGRGMKDLICIRY